MVYGLSGSGPDVASLQGPEGPEQWRRFKAEVCHAHAYWMEVLVSMRRSSGNLVLLSMVMRDMQQQGHIMQEQRHINSLLEGLAKQVQQLSMGQQATNQRLEEGIKA